MHEYYSDHLDSNSYNSNYNFMSNYIIWIIIGVPALIIIWAISAYNRFVRLVHRAREAWSDIEVQMKRRYDLIPNLVETVKGYTTHERDVFEKVTQARAAAISAKTVKEHGQAENMLSGALKTLFAVAEAYPQLRAAENFVELQRELSDTENKIQAARRFHNSNVVELNVALESFPSNIIGKTFGFYKMELFDLEEESARQPVRVAFK